MRPFGEWRLEVEMQSPCTPSVLTRGLYLHQLLRSLILGGAFDPQIHGGVFACTALTTVVVGRARSSLVPRL